MLYRILVACLLVSASALQVGPTAVSGRRAALAKAASLAATAVPLAAFAELKQASDADVYARADANKLNAARVIQRAKDGELVDGSSATCSELDKLIAVDQDALEFEKEKLEAMGGNDPAQKKIVADVEKKIEAQIKKPKGCAGLKKAGDADVYTRADEGKLSAARAIERAKTGDLVDGSSATCSELEKIIAVDKKALAYEKDKLEAMGNKAPAQAKVVKDVSAQLEAQLKKLDGKKKE